MMEFKRGNTFDFTGTVEVQRVLEGELVDLTGWSATSHIRNQGGEQIAELTVEILDGPARLVRIFAPGTTDQWPLGCVQTDILFVSPPPESARVSTATSEFEITEGPTRVDRA